MSWKWFVKQGDRVEGPFTTDDVTHRLASGLANAHDLIWGPGNESWQSLQSWQATASSLNQSQNQRQTQSRHQNQENYETETIVHTPTQAPSKPQLAVQAQVEAEPTEIHNFDRTMTQIQILDQSPTPIHTLSNEETVVAPVAAPAAAVAWHYAVDGKTNGPVTREQMIAHLKNVSGEVMVWTKGMKEWAPLYEFDDLLTDLGINKRQYPRIDINGKAVLRGSGTNLIAPLLSISEAGFGVALENGVVVGEDVDVELQSSVFRAPIEASAVGRYVGNGVIGFKFTKIKPEDRAAITALIKANQVRFPIKAA